MWHGPRPGASWLVPSAAARGRRSGLSGAKAVRCGARAKGRATGEARASIPPVACRARRRSKVRLRPLLLQVEDQEFALEEHDAERGQDERKHPQDRGSVAEPGGGERDL